MSVTIPEPDGCPWPVDPACLTDEWESSFDEPTQDRAIALAGNTLRRLTAFRVGGCPRTIRPCTSSCAVPLGWSWDLGSPFTPVNWAGAWSNCGCGGLACAHSPGRSVRIPGMVSVKEVKVGATVLIPDTDYWVDGDQVIRLGSVLWPTTQDLSLPPGSPDTFTITYYDSYPVDGMGAYAAGKLAMQYAKACKTGKCSLPEQVTQIVRQGVSYSIPAGSFPNGETGIREVDAYIALWNPGHRKNRLQAWSP